MGSGGIDAETGERNKGEAVAPARVALSESADDAGCVRFLLVTLAKARGRSPSPTFFQPGPVLVWFPRLPPTLFSVNPPRERCAYRASVGRPSRFCLIFLCRAFPLVPFPNPDCQRAFAFRVWCVYRVRV